MNTRRDFFRAAGIAVLAAQGAPAKPRRFTDFDAPARQLLSSLSLDEKIGQMTQPDQQYLKSLDDIETYHLGSLLSGGNSDPKSGNDPDSWTAMCEGFQKRALAARPRIPLLYGIDSVHGSSNVIGAVMFPHNIGLGCTRNAKLVEEIGRLTASETRAIGANWAFSPCVTVPQDIRWGRTYEGFSEDPSVVAPLGAAATRGLQWDDLVSPHSVLACVKHFAGDGGTTFNTGMPRGRNSTARYPLDRGDTRGNEETLFQLHIAGYIPSIAAGAGSIMPSYSSWNGEKCSGSKRLLTGILKERLGFQGFLISDYNALGELPGSYQEQIAQSINAGMDMVMVPRPVPGVHPAAQGERGRGQSAAVAHRRRGAAHPACEIRYGDDGAQCQPPGRGRGAQGVRFGRTSGGGKTGSARIHRGLEKRTQSAAATPRARPASHVAGKSMDDIGNQCGGWTITWQGKSGATTKGTTILAALRTVAGRITTSVDGSGTEGADVGVAVIGETPYAEFEGDRTDLKLAPEDVAAVKNLKRAGIPVVAVIVSGRPLVIDEILADADAIVAAWWPGSEGDGVADVLFGSHPPKGKLSFTWPAGGSTTFLRGAAGYKTLYAFGHGLGY